VKLISVDLTGFKRFEQTTKINLDAKLIALVGPNEAGKTSILEALGWFGSAEPIPRSEWTRATTPDADDVAVEALWLLSPEDLEDVDIPQGDEPPRWLIHKKLFGGARRVVLSPALKRAKGPRRRAREELDKLSRSKWVAEAEEPPFDLDQLRVLHAELDTDQGTLPPEIRERIGAFGDLLGGSVAEDDAAPVYARDLVERLEKLREHEDATHPNRAAIQELGPLIPAFLPFTDDARSLESAHELMEVAFDPPSALGNLAALAGLQLGSLLEAIQAGDLGHAEDLLLAATGQLSKELNRAWGQSEIEPRLTHDGTVLRIFIKTDYGGFLDVARRSEGLRTFMALVAFTARQGGSRPPILLIDEAEEHLHYDAQADLTQMLARQDQAAQVIYTTHSAGCLPQDLGTGVRLVVPAEGVDRSRVENWPWAEGVGFSPLLLGMGASTLAFVPTRAALIGEGGAEVIVLPTLLREVANVSDVPFQVAPGSAEASKDAIARIDLEGNKVAYLVDGDDGGAGNQADLRSAGIAADRIVIVGGEGSGLSTEDLVAPEVYAAAINEELRRSHGENAPRLDPGALPETGRPAAVAAWCEQQGVPEPNKGAVAHRIADQRSERSLVDPAREDLVEELYETLLGLFE